MTWSTHRFTSVQRKAIKFLAIIFILGGILVAGGIFIGRWTILNDIIIQN